MSETTMAANSAEENRAARDTPGAKLEAERRRQGLSIPDVARHLKLAPRQVEALENDEYNALPGVVFVRGFMRNYARALNLDPEPLVRAAEQTLGVSAMERPIAGPTTIGKPTMDDTGTVRRPGSSRWLPGLVIALALAAGIGYFLYTENMKKAPDAPPPVSQTVTPPATAAGNESTSTPVTPSSTTGVATPAATAGATDSAGTSASSAPATAAAGAAAVGAAATADSATAAAPAATATSSDKPELRFTFTKASWVEIKDKSNKVIFSKPTDPGGERVVQGTPPFKLKIGNASGVKLVYNGKEIDLKPHRRSNDVAYLVLE